MCVWIALYIPLKVIAIVYSIFAPTISFVAAFASFKYIPCFSCSGPIATVGQDLLGFHFKI